MYRFWLHQVLDLHTDPDDDYDKYDVFIRPIEIGIPPVAGMEFRHQEGFDLEAARVWVNEAGAVIVTLDGPISAESSEDLSAWLYADWARVGVDSNLNMVGPPTAADLRLFPQFFRTGRAVGQVATFPRPTTTLPGEPPASEGPPTGRPSAGASSTGS